LSEDSCKELLKIKKPFLLDACDMLIFENGLATCLIERYFGYNAKPLCCQTYPDGKPCALFVEEELNKGHKPVWL